MVSDWFKKWQSNHRADNLLVEAVCMDKNRFKSDIENDTIDGREMRNERNGNRQVKTEGIMKEIGWNVENLLPIIMIHYGCMGSWLWFWEKDAIRNTNTNLTRTFPCALCYYANMKPCFYFLLQSFQVFF